MKWSVEKVVLLVISLLIIFSIGTTAGFATCYIHRKDDLDFQSYQKDKWIYNINDFNEKNTDYNIIVEYIKNNFQQFLDDNFFVEISFTDNIDIQYRTAQLNQDNGEITYGEQQRPNFIMTHEEQSSINSIIESFKNSGKKLKYILLYNDRISFFRDREPYERSYALIYMFQNSKPDFLFQPDEFTKKSIKKVQGQWYHVVQNPL